MIRATLTALFALTVVLVTADAALTTVLGLTETLTRAATLKGM